MIAKFNYCGHRVVISDSEGVSCKDSETKKQMEIGYKIFCGDITKSPAEIIGISMEEIGIEVEYIDDGIIY